MKTKEEALKEFEKLFPDGVNKDHPFIKGEQIAFTTETRAFLAEVWQAAQEATAQVFYNDLVELYNHGHGGGNWRRLILTLQIKLRAK